MSKHRAITKQYYSSSSTCFRLMLTTVILPLLYYTLPGAIASPLTSSHIDGSSVYSSVLTLNHPQFAFQPDQPHKQFYYEAIEVNIPISGVYIFTSKSLIALHGYLYDGDFNPSDSSAKLIVQNDDRNLGDGQLRMSVELEANHKYMLVVATSDLETVGEFSIFSSGPRKRKVRDVTVSSQVSTTGYLLRSSTISARSIVSGSLSSSSPVFSRANATIGAYYYQAIRVAVITSGIYTFTSSSSSSTDLYGYLYFSSFDPSYPFSYLFASDDDSGGNGQFQIRSSLQAGQVYVLVVTTFDQGRPANYAVQSSGPNTVSFILFTPSTTPRPVVPTTTPSSTYSGYLSSSSFFFVRPGQSTGYFYYQALRVTVYASGAYTFISTTSGSTDMYGILYSDPFNPANPSSNMITSDDDGAGSGQFRITQTLQSSRTYVLIVTTYASTTTATYSIRASGAGLVTLSPFSPTTTNSPSSGTSGYLSSSSFFFRPSGSSSSYYYFQAIRLTIYSTGFYTFTSSSSTDLYGYLYSSSFDPSYPSSNMIASDDDGAGSGQFQVRYSMYAGQTYILVVTTFSSTTSASYSIRSSGPGLVTFTTFTPSTSRPITTTTYCGYSCGYNSVTRTGIIIGATIGSILLLSIIIGVCAHYQKQQNSQRVRIAPVSGSGASGMLAPPRQQYPMNNMDRRMPSGPYVIARSPQSFQNVEMAPPSYDAAIAYHKAHEQQRDQHVF